MTRRTFDIGCIEKCLKSLFVAFFVSLFDAKTMRIFQERYEKFIDSLVRHASLLFFLIFLQRFLLFLERFFLCFLTHRLTRLWKLFNKSRIDLHIIRLDFVSDFFNWLSIRNVSCDEESLLFLPLHLLILPSILDVDHKQIAIEERSVRCCHVHEGNCLVLIVVAMLIVDDPNQR